MIPPEVKEACRALTVESINALAEVMRDIEHPQRVQAANSLLDRGWGRPTQPVSGDDTMPPVAILFGK